MKKFLIALQFLTILPVKHTLAVNEADVTRSSSFFVLVGLFQGILLTATDYLAGRVFHPDLVTGIVLLVYVVSNGGFHLDGLADTFDAIAAKSGGNPDADKQKRLSVLKDPSTGPAGVTAILFSLGLKYLSLNSVANFLPFTYYSSLLLLPVIPKWTMVISMYHGRRARENGLGSLFLRKIGMTEVAVSTIILLLLFALPQLFFSDYIPDNQNIFYAVLLITMYFLCRVWIQFCNRKFGGLTGDMLGAASEMTEVTFLLMVILWSRLSM
jgi:adenosylcobinamide-GDP ribazoletransferase